MVPITPSREWSLSDVSHPSQPGAVQPSLLGLSLRVCQPEFALDNVWHILEILEGSPAESAGLVPYGDWIVGWSGGTLGKEGDFYEVVEAVSCLTICKLCQLLTLSCSMSRNLYGFMCTLMTLSGSSSLTTGLKANMFFSSTLREVVLVPNRMWGGEGLLGCGVG